MLHEQTMGRVNVKAAVGDVGWCGFCPRSSSSPKGRRADLCSSGGTAVEWSLRFQKSGSGKV